MRFKDRVYVRTRGGNGFIGASLCREQTVVHNTTMCLTLQPRCFNVFWFYFTAINYVGVWLFKRHKILRVVQVKLITKSEISIHFWKVRVPTNSFRNLSLIKIVFW